MKEKGFLIWLNLTLAVVVIFAISRCDRIGSKGFRRTHSGTFTDIYNGILQPNCASCHNPTDGTANQNGVTLDFSSQPAAFQTLTQNTVTAGDFRDNCSGVKIVVAQDVPDSYLMAVLWSSYTKTGFVNPNCTPYAGHQDNLGLSADDQNEIITWINAGAPNS
jgi:hypothetical protein